VVKGPPKSNMQNCTPFPYLASMKKIAECVQIQGRPFWVHCYRKRRATEIYAKS